MDIDQIRLEQTVTALLQNGKGIIALDESTASAAKRLAIVGLDNTEENRQTFREIFITAPAMEEYASGVILFDETLRQKDRSGKSFRSILERKGVVIGIKVDEGLEVADNPQESLTKGLFGLEDRLEEYAALGAQFAKWRSVVVIGEGLPTQENLKENAQRMAIYAKRCQESGIVPIVEPEVLMDGAHSQAQAKSVVREALLETVEALQAEGVWLPGVIIKTSMVVPGKESGEPMVAQSVAEDTATVLREVVPEEIGGVVFLSGGQSTEDAFDNLSAIAKISLPFEVASSFGRALQFPAIEVWDGKDENILDAQSKFVSVCAQMSAADKGLRQ